LFCFFLQFCNQNPFHELALVVAAAATYFILRKKGKQKAKNLACKIFCGRIVDLHGGERTCWLTSFDVNLLTSLLLRDLGVFTSLPPQRAQSW
jgi:hypothetical protein